VFLNLEGKKISSNIDLLNKELVAKLFCLNDKAFETLKKSQDGTFTKQWDKAAAVHPNYIPGLIFNLIEINSTKKWFSHRKHKEYFFEMYKHDWDIGFIINYVNTVKQRKINVNPQDFVAPYF